MGVSLLSQYVQQKKSSGKRLEILPLFHTCEGYDGKQILATGKLEIKKCKEFKKKLLYFFYGKPSYPVSLKNKENRTDAFYCPVCFVINPEKVDVYQVFPFDTGAFKEKIYEGFIHRNMKLDNYELDNNLDSILAYISVMFGNNEDYLNGICHQKKSKLVEIQALLNMLNANGSFQVDERANTVEIISKRNLKLVDAIECLILPKNLLRVKEVAAFIEENRIKYKGYNIRRLTAPDRYNEIVFQLAMEYINIKGRTR